MNWSVHQENICILGMQHSGKTSLAKSFLDNIPNVPRLIISPQQPQKLYGSYGQSINAVSELIEGGAYVWTGKLTEPIFEALCKKLMTFSNMLLVLDDAHEFCTKQRIPKNLSNLINSGRNRGITSIFISPSPNLLNNVVLQSSRHLIAFHFRMESQIEYAKKNFFGDYGWLLLSPNLRPSQFKKYIKIGEHDYLYQNENSEDITYIKENGDEIIIKSIEDFPTGDNENNEEVIDEEIETEKVETVKEKPVEEIEEKQKEELEEID